MLQIKPQELEAELIRDAFQMRQGRTTRLPECDRLVFPDGQALYQARVVLGEFDFLRSSVAFSDAQERLKRGFAFSFEMRGALEKQSLCSA